jgi:hypothetical protein
MWMSTSPDPYELLGVARDATPDEIKAAFRHLAKAAHPDAEGSAGLYRALTEARDALIDPERRRRIDRGEPAEPKAAEAPQTTAPPRPSPEDAWAQVPVPTTPGPVAPAADQGWSTADPPSPRLAASVGKVLRDVRSWPPGAIAGAAVLIRAVESSAFSNPSGAVGYAVGAIVTAVLVTALWPLARQWWAERGYRRGVGLAVVVIAVLLVAVPAALPAFLVLAIIAGVLHWRRRRAARR